MQGMIKMQRLQPSIRFIQDALKRKQYRLTRHATIFRVRRHITMAQMIVALGNGEIIEKYPDAEPYPACLVLGWLESGDPLHIVCSRGEIEPQLRIVTLYEPDDNRWEDDYKTRKVK